MRRTSFLLNTLIAGYVITALSSPILAEETAVSVDSRDSLALTIYNQNLGLVKDRRSLALDGSGQTLAFAGISPQALPETVILDTIDKGAPLHFGTRVFDFDVLTYQRMMKAAVGQEVSVVSNNPKTGETTTKRARVLAFNDHPVLEIDGKIHFGSAGPESATEDSVGRIVFDSLPPGVRVMPTLLAEVKADKASSRKMELAYLTGGLNWRADYVAELGSDGNSLDLSGWATLTNTTGADFMQASVKLIAGDINRERHLPSRDMMEKGVMMSMAASPEPPPAREQLMGLHVYTLPGMVDLPNQQTRQVLLLNAAGVTVREERIIRSDMRWFHQQADSPLEAHADLQLLLDNTEKGGLGTPLPAGTVRVYRRDSSGELQFVGEDGVDHTGEGRTLRLHLGQDFDVTAERKQTDFKRLSDRLIETAQSIKLTNGKDVAVNVRVIESMTGEWTILESSAPADKTSARTAEWMVNVPAKGKAEVTFRVRSKL